MPGFTVVSTFGMMLSRQEELMKHYQEIEFFPDWPLDLDAKENQTLLRKFGERFLQELSEAFSEVETTWGLISTNQQEQAKEGCKRFNLEIGDSICFLLELLLFSGITEDDLKGWLENLIKEEPSYQALIKPDEVLSSLLKLAHFRNMNEGFTINAEEMMQVMPMIEIVKNANHEWLGIRRMSEGFCNKIAIYCWYITHGTLKALNLLKNKEWNQTERVTNKFLYQTELVGVLVMYIQFMQYIEKSEESIWKSYNLAYLKNIKRIKGGY